MKNLVCDNSREDFPVDYIGGKGKGLLKLKNLEKELRQEYFWRIKKVEIPNFFIIPVGYDLNFKENLFKLADSLGPKKLAVRSSSPYEDAENNSFDGIFESHLDVSRDDLLEAINSVKNSALGKKAVEYSKEFNVPIDNKMAVIVQKMVSRENTGIIYSKFPAISDVTRIISNFGNKTENILFERKTLDYYDESGNEIKEKKIVSGRRIIQDGNLGHIDFFSGFSELSHFVEKKFGYPVRIEYSYDGEKEELNLLQARSIEKGKSLEKIIMPELEAGNLIAGTYGVNGIGDVTLPLVNIINSKEDGKEHHISENEIEKLDKKYKNGYILLAQYLKFDDNYIDPITPHKKAAIIGSQFLGGDDSPDHDWDIARKKGLLYLLIPDFYFEFSGDRKSPLKTGDMVRIISDGVKGMVYKVD